MSISDLASGPPIRTTQRLQPFAAPRLALPAPALAEEPAEAEAQDEEEPSAARKVYMSGRHQPREIKRDVFFVEG